MKTMTGTAHQPAVRKRVRAVRAACLLLPAAAAFAAPDPVLRMPVPGGTAVATCEWVVFDSGNGHLPALRLVDQSGRDGYWVGDYLPKDAGAAAAMFLEKLKGLDAANPEALWDRMQELGFPVWLQSAVDIAAWDLYGRAQGKPVGHLLGTLRRDKVALYVAGFPQMTAEENAEAVRQTQARGIRAYKIYTYLKGMSPERNASDPAAEQWIERDISIARAVRAAAGPETALMFYPGNSYNPEQAERVGAVLDELGYAWFYDPMPQRDASALGNHLELKTKIKTPLCAPIAGNDRSEWVRRRAADMAEVDVYEGGFTACLRLLRLCAREGVPLDLHGGFINDIYQFPLYGIADDATVPWIGFHHRNPMKFPVAAEFPASEPGPEKRPWIKRIQARPIDAQGFVRIGYDIPGIGVELDWEWIRARDIGKPKPAAAAASSAVQPSGAPVPDLLRPFFDPDFVPAEGPDTDKAWMLEATAAIRAALPERLAVPVAGKRRILLLSSGSMGPLHTPGQAGLVLLLRESAAKYGVFELIEMYDDAGLDAGALKGVDAVVLNNTGRSRNDGFYNEILPDYVRGGGGVAALHAALLPFRDKPEAAYNVMFGGYVTAAQNVHPKRHHRTFSVELPDPEHPLAASFRGEETPVTLNFNWLNGKVRTPYSVTLTPPRVLADELYILYRASGQEHPPQVLSRVVKEGAEQVFPEDTDEFTWALSWIKPYGKGRVFYTQLGHNMALFGVPCVAQSVLDGLLYATGDLPVPPAGGTAKN